MNFISESGGVLKIDHEQLEVTVEAVLGGQLVPFQNWSLYSERSLKVPSLDSHSLDEIAEMQRFFTAQRERVLHKKVYREMFNRSDYLYLFREIDDEARANIFLEAYMHHYPEATEKQRDKRNAYIDWVNGTSPIEDYATHYQIPCRELRQVKTYMPRYVLDALIYVTAEEMTVRPPTKPPKLLLIERVDDLE